MKKKILIIPAILLILLLFVVFGGLSYLKSNYFSEVKVHDGRTNLLLLGINGKGSADNDLTDTIIFVSLDQNKRQISLLSIPRDIWMTDIQAKINTAYHYGGIQLAKKEIGEVTGQEIDYVLIINFDGFEKIIDILGGVDINVTRSFEDLFYPIAGKEADLCNDDKELKCRYEHLVFEKGWQRMDGNRTLKFVRSRNAKGEEGTDFARSQRQILVLKAIKSKLQSPDLYLNFNKIKSIADVLEENIKTEIGKNQYGNFASIGLKINFSQINNIAFDENLLINPKYHYSKQWVLIPANNDWVSVHYFVERSLQ